MRIALFLLLAALTALLSPFATVGGFAPTGTRCRPSSIDELSGTWLQVGQHGLAEYLTHLGVGWARRKAATSFTPLQTWVTTDGGLRMTMRSPLGKFAESFPLHRDERERDMDGRTFLKRTTWTRQGELTAVSRDVTGKMTDVIATRWLEAGPGASCHSLEGHGVRMVQETCHERVCYRRVFERQPAASQ